VAGDVLMADVGTGEGYSAHRSVDAFRILHNVLMHLSIAQSSVLWASSGSHVSSAHLWTSIHQVFRQRQVRLSGAHVSGVGGALLLLMQFAAQSGRMRSARTSRKPAKMMQRTSLKACMIPVSGSSRGDAVRGLDAHVATRRRRSRSCFLVDCGTISLCLLEGGTSNR
jgi:hypothetical protein